jgi:AAA+ ATPase superfamily predicted ATPase
MATESLNNPCADYGGIVYDQRFIGRTKEIRQIVQRVMGETYGNLAIMGLPRIGKSSLAWQAIMTKREDLLKNKTLPIFFQVGSCDSSETFYRELVSYVHDELEFICEDDRYEKFSSRIIKDLQDSDDKSVIIPLVQKYFKLVKRLGYKVIYILDEFDSVQAIFSVSDFQTLRELSTKPDTKICIVTCSRKTIQEIESKDGAISNFYGTFSEIRLGMFSDTDMQEYWDRISADYKLSQEYKEYIQFCIGSHPYLLDMCNDYSFRNCNFFTNINEVEDIRIQLWHQFRTIQDTLSHEGLLDKAIQLVLGPAYNVKKLEEERLLKYQFIKKVDNEEKINVLGRLTGSSADERSQTYMCFSDYFTIYFDRQHWESVDYWPLWTATEKAIRRIIKTYVKRQFSEDWETELYAKYGNSTNWANQFNSVKGVRERERKTFPSASLNLIDYTMSREMYNVFMAPAWNDWFQKIFVGNKKDWAAKFNFLAEIRNPMAHNNREFISNEQITLATQYCEEINRTIEEWEAKGE